MTRRRSYVSTFAQMQREAARAQAAQVRAQTAARKEAERARTAYLRAQVADEKERKRLYAESRAAEVAAKNDDLEAEIAALQGLLAATFKVNDQISFSSLKKPAAVPPWRHPELEKPEPPPVPDAFKPAPPTGLSKVFGKGKYEQAFEEGRVKYEGAVQEHAVREQQRAASLAKARAEWQAAVESANAEARRQHAEVDAFEAEYRRGTQDAVAAYCSMVLEASQYPQGFPQQFKLAYVPESRQAVVEYELPTVAVVPAVKAYRYVKTSDAVTETSRPQLRSSPSMPPRSRRSRSARSMSCWRRIQEDTSTRWSSMALSTPPTQAAGGACARAW
jgi:restriction system protein